MYQIIKRVSKLAVAGTLAVFSIAVAAALSLPIMETAMAQQAGEVQSLRGGTGIPDDSLKPAVAPQQTKEGSFARAYRQQPPLIPHTIDVYEITLKENQCMLCHDWPYNVDQGAPKISETHYLSRDGVALDQVAPRRWFCNQCHVPQSDAKELVTNNFKSAADVK